MFVLLLGVAGLIMHSQTDLFANPAPLPPPTGTVPLLVWPRGTEPVAIGANHDFGPLSVTLDSAASSNKVPVTVAYPHVTHGTVYALGVPVVEMGYSIVVYPPLTSDGPYGVQVMSLDGS